MDKILDKYNMNKEEKKEIKRLFNNIKKKQKKEENDMIDDNELEECDICCEKFDKDKHKRINCLKCDLKICRTCVEKILLEQNITYNCPKCKCDWDFYFIYSNFKKSFINNELKNNYGKICYEFELQHKLKEYKNYIEIINKIYKSIIELYNLDFDKLYYLIKENENIIFKLSYNNQISNEQKILMFNDLLKKYNNNKDINKYDLLNDYAFLFCKDTLIIYCFYIKNTNKDYYDKNIIYEKNYEKYKFSYNILLNNDVKKIESSYLTNIFNNIIKIMKNNNIYVTKQIKKIGKCFNDNCDGDIYKYKNQIICNKCNSIFCNKCYKQIYPKMLEIYNKDIDNIEEIENYYFLTYDKNIRNKIHKCNEDDINTVKLLTDNVKNCPKCEFPIYKINGCDHMWCPECHTMFNWSNLQITKTTTNPLYFQWLRQQGLTPQRYNHPDAQPINCNEQLNVNQCKRIINSYIDINLNNEFFYKISKILELKQKSQNNGSMDMYRIKYMFNMISEEQYKKYISTRYISKQFIDNYNLIILNMIQTISDIFHNIKTEGEQQNNLSLNNEQIENYKNQFIELINIYNEQMIGLYNIYPNLTVQIINEDYLIETLGSKDEKNIEPFDNESLTDLNIYNNSVLYLFPINEQNDYIMYYITLLYFHYRHLLEKNIEDKYVKYSFCYPCLELINNEVLHIYILKTLEELNNIVINNNIKFNINEKLINDFYGYKKSSYYYYDCIFSHLYKSINRILSYLNYNTYYFSDINDNKKLLFKLYDIFKNKSSNFINILNNHKKLLNTYNSSYNFYSYNYNYNSYNSKYNDIKLSGKMKNINIIYNLKTYNPLSSYLYDKLNYAYKYHKKNLFKELIKINFNPLFLDLNYNLDDFVYFNLSFRDYIISFYKPLDKILTKICKKKIKS